MDDDEDCFENEDGEPDELTMFPDEDDDEFLAFLAGDWAVDGDILGFFGF